MKLLFQEDIDERMSQMSLWQLKPNGSDLKPKRTLIICLIGVLFLVPALVFGASVFTDNFNSYDFGDLNGQDGWLGDDDHYYQIVPDSYEGLGVSCEGCGQIRIHKFGTPLANGEVLIYLKSNSSVEGEGTLFELREGENTIMNVGFADPNIGYSSFEGWKILLENYSVDTWYKIGIQWRFNVSDSIPLWRFRVNDNCWSDWTFGGNNFENYIDSYQFYSNKYGGDFSYFDLISEPVQGTFFTLPPVKCFLNYTNSLFIDTGAWLVVLVSFPLAFWFIKKFLTLKIKK